MNKVKRSKFIGEVIQRLSALVLALAVIVLVPGGCRLSGRDPAEKGKLSIVATIFPPYDFARQIGGEHVNVTLLLPPGSESHTYEPTPKEIVRIAEADLFIYTGGVSDTWVERLLDAAEIDRAKTVRMMDYVNALEESHEGILDREADHHDHADGAEPAGEDHHEGDGSSESKVQDNDGHRDEDAEGSDHEEEHGHGHEHGLDEHIWTSPVNALKIAEGIVSRLIAADKKHESDYRKNFDNLRHDLMELDKEFRAIRNEAKHPELIVADRFPLLYFASEYGFSYMAAYPGCAAETEPKPQTVAAMIEKVRSGKVAYVFYIEFSNQKLADLITAETGAGKLLFHSAHNVTMEEMKGGATYVSIMRANAENLRKALIGS